jgi:O-succinylbenzoic acid--CoA ligase
MAPCLSLAQLLQQSALQHGANLALQTSERIWSFAELLADTKALAKQLPFSDKPLILNGSSLELARHAYACSHENQPFWPVHRSIESKHSECIYPDAALIISTSGSEGSPRAVVLGNQQMDVAAGLANQTLDLCPGDLWLNCLPLFHIGGQSILWRCAKAGAGVFLTEGFALDQVADALNSRAITHISLVPATLASVLEQGVQPPDSLRVTLIGGAALSQKLYERATQSGWPLFVSYGMSETAAQLATFTPRDGKWTPGQVGSPMPGHEIRISNQGRVSIRGPQVMLGYLDSVGLNEGDWLTTGDLGSLDSHGSLTIKGRADDMLISGGRNTHPLEIESCLAAYPGVSEVAVTGHPDPVWGDLIVAVMVGNAAEENLRVHAKNSLHSAAQPRKYLFVDALPKTPAGKPDRAKIRQIAIHSAR